MPGSHYNVVIAGGSSWAGDQEGSKPPLLPFKVPDQIPKEPQALLSWSCWAPAVPQPLNSTGYALPRVTLSQVQAEASVKAFPLGSPTAPLPLLASELLLRLTP